MSELATRSLLFGEYFLCSDDYTDLAYATVFRCLFDTYPMQNVDRSYQPCEAPTPLLSYRKTFMRIAATRFEWV